jgi:CPA2 family monovalent cation:H+ antiporter-2
VSGPELAVTIVRLVAFLTVLMGAGMLVVPRAMRYVVGLRRRETTLVVSIGLCFGTALLAGMIGYSVALGAFLAGSLVAESGAEQLVERLVEPVRDMFAAVFFVSVGMMIDPRLVIAHWQAVLLFTVLVIVGKIVAVSVSAFFTGTGVRTAVQAGMSLAQIGEFSFIIAGVGLAAGGASSTLYTIMVAVSAITTLTTPWLIRQAGPTADAIDRNLPRPLQTLVALYGSWIESTRRRPETSAERARTQRLLRGMGIDAAVVGALCVGASIAAAPLGARVAAATGLRPDQGRAILVAVAVLLSLPFLIGIFRLGRALGNDVARRAFSDPEPGRLDLAAAPRRSLVITIQVAAILVVGAALVAVTQPFLPPVAGIALVAGMLILLGILVWRSAADLQGHVRAAAVGIVEVLGRQSRDPAAPDAERALERAYQLLPGLGEPFPVRILDHYPVVGRTLSELRLRSRTAATIVVISRGEHVVLMPDGHETLHAGDVVALAGTRPAIEAAKQLLLDGRES